MKVGQQSIGPGCTWHGVKHERIGHVKAKLYPITSQSEVSEAVEAAREALRAHETIVIPTDTVYGIAADAFSHRGVAKLLADKGRSRTMPPPVMIFDLASLPGVAAEIPDEAYELGRKFWPGALTMILYAYPSLEWDLGDTRGTVAVRVPDNEFARKLLTEHGPLAVSSANRTGMPAASSATEALEQLGDKVSIIVDTAQPVQNADAADEEHKTATETAQDSVEEKAQPHEHYEATEDTEDTAKTPEDTEEQAEDTETQGTEAVTTGKSISLHKAPPEADGRAQTGTPPLPSTILDCTSTPFVVVREGAISLQELREVVPSIVTRAELDEKNSAANRAKDRTEADSEDKSQEGLEEAYEHWDSEHKESAEEAPLAASPSVGSVGSLLMDAVTGVFAGTNTAIDQRRTRTYRNNTPQPVKTDTAPLAPVSVADARALVFGADTAEAEDK